MRSPKGSRRVDTAGRSLTTLFLSIPALLFATAAFAGDEPDPAKTVVPVGDVAVTAMRSSREVLETPGRITVLDREDIEESGATNVAELLRRQGGLFVTNSTSSRTGYSIEPRGFANGSGGGSSLLVQVDGRRINSPTLSTADWSLLHLDDIERIEIVHGAASALYGDNAIGGVVNIITRTGEGPATATGTARFSRHRGREGSLRTGASAGPVSLSFFVDRYRSDSYRDQAVFRVENYKGNFRAELGDRGSLALRGGWSTDDRDSPGPLNEAELESDRRQVDPDSTGNHTETRSRFVDGVLEFSPLDDLNLELQGYYSKRSDRGVSSSAVGDFAQDFTAEAIGINTKAQLDKEIAGRPFRLVAGVDLLREDRDGNDAFISLFFNSRDRRRTTRRLVGAFVQNELEIADGLILSAGIRHDRAEYRIITIDEMTGAKEIFEPTHSIWSPRFGALYRITENISAYANYSRGFRLPNLAETSGVLTFNPEVEPQRSHGWEIGVKHHGKRFRGDLTVYRMDVVDEIIANSDVVFFFPGPTLGVQNTNLDRVRHQGFETSWSIDILDWFEIHGNYTYDDTRVRRDDVTNLDNNQVPITPRHRGLIGFLAHLPFWFEFGMDGQFVGERYGINDWGQDFDKIDDHRRWDAHVAWRPKINEHLALSIFADVQNFMGRRYVETGGRPTFVAVGAPAALAFFPAPEREWSAGFSVTVRQ